MMSKSRGKYETDRIRKLRAGEINGSLQQIVDDVATFGSHVISVSGNAASFGFTYSIGIYDTTDTPEIITVALSPSTAQAALNYARDAARDGIDLTQGSQRGMVGEVDVIFRVADPTWVEQTMLATRRFYQGWEFPVLQLIYPDLQNKFQWEEGFDERFRQPLLQPDAIETDVEEDFRKSLDPNSSFFEWKFPDDPHTNAFLSETVNKGEEAVTYVSHDDDGAWQFLGDQMSDGGGPVLVCLHHPIDKDATLKEIADLPVGWYAERTQSVNLGHEESTPTFKNQTLSFVKLSQRAKNVHPHLQHPPRLRPAAH